MKKADCESGLSFHRQIRFPYPDTGSNFALETLRCHALFIYYQNVMGTRVSYARYDRCGQRISADWQPAFNLTDASFAAPDVY